MLGSMGRKRQSNFNLPPRMNMKADTYYYVTSGPKREWISLGKDKARAFVLWAELAGKTLERDGFSKAIDELMASPWFDGLSKASQIAYKKVHEPLKEFFKGSDLDMIQPHHIAAWLDNHKSPVMANIGRALVSNVMKRALRKGEIQRNPCKDMSGLAIKSRTRYMTDQEFIAIREKANDLVRVCMNLSYVTGMRIGDVLRIQLADIKPDGLYLTQHKTGKKQVFGMTPELELALFQAKEMPRSVRNITHLLCSRRGTPYTYDAINVAFREAKIAAGVPDVHFHDIRAKAATDAKRQGIDYQAMLGHTSKAMSDKYIRQFEFEKVAPLKHVL